MDLSIQEIERAIKDISLGYRIITIENTDGEEVSLILYHPSSFDKVVADHIYNTSLKKAEKEGLPTQEEMELIIKNRGLYNQGDDDEIEKIRGQIKGQKLVLSKTTRIPARRDRIKGIIKELEEKAARIMMKKEKYLEQTRERKALEEKLLYLTWQSSYTITNNKYWENYDDFLNEEDFLFRKKVYLEYSIYYYGYNQETIRAIARSNLWRLQYLAPSKTNDPLFGRSMPEYTVDQLSLVYWSQFYQNVFEMMSDERPSEEIIEDDEALDAYMNDWYAERNRDQVASKSKKNSLGKPSAWDHQETLVMASNPIFKDVEYSETLSEHVKNKGKSAIDAAPMGRSRK